MEEVVVGCAKGGEVVVVLLAVVFVCRWAACV